MSDLECKISDFMMSFAKFEYLLMSNFPELAKTKNVVRLRKSKITGMNWSLLARCLERKKFFSELDGFGILIDTPPQVLFHDEENRRVSWDSDDAIIRDWESLLIVGLVRVRNNVAHGNKVHPNRAFTNGRSEEYIECCQGLMDVIVNTLCEEHAEFRSDVIFN